MSVFNDSALKLQKEKVNVTHEDNSTLLHVVLKSFPNNMKVIERALTNMTVKNTNLLTPEKILFKAVERILEDKINPNAKDSEGNTAMHLIPFSEACSLNILQELLKYGGCVNEVNIQRQTPLHLAVRNLKVVEELLARKNNVNAKDVNGDTPLHVALSTCGIDFDVVKTFVSNGASVKGKNKKGETALHIAARYNAPLRVIRELISAGAMVNAKDKYKNRPLHFLCNKFPGDLPLIKELLMYGAYINVRGRKGRTPLHLAVKHKVDIEVIREVVKCSANLNIRDEYGETPLHLALLSSPTNFHLIELLLSRGAFVNATNNYGQTPLHNATDESATFEVVQLLLKYGAHLNVKDQFNTTPLHFVLINAPGNVRLVKELLKIGALVNERDIEQLTPLHYACKGGLCTEIVEQLLEYGAEVNAKDQFGFTPLHFVVYGRYNNVNLISTLLTNGASVHMRNWGDRTPLHYVLRRKHLADELLKYALIEHGDDINCVVCKNARKVFETSFLECKCEIEKMKKDVIVDKFTLYDFVVLKHDYGKLYMDDNDILSDLLTLKDKYPKYHDVIVNVLETRTYLLRKFCRGPIFVRTNLNEFVNVNSYCLNEIGGYLSKRDLKNFFNGVV